jgi:outer membrane protein
MKKIIITVVVLFCSLVIVHAQKFAFVDSQYILDNLPEYTEAQAQLDEISTLWQKEIEAKFAEVDKMNQNFQAQAVLLPEDMKKKKEQEIQDKEKEAKNLERQRFGQNGDLMKKRQELVKPIQEKVYNAIQEIATNNSYAVILDKAGALTILFANPKYDLSDEVLDNLGTAAGGRKGRTTGGQKGLEGGAGSNQGGTKSNNPPGDNNGQPPVSPGSRPKK